MLIAFVCLAVVMLLVLGAVLLWPAWRLRLAERSAQDARQRRHDLKDAKAKEAAARDAAAPPTVIVSSQAPSRVPRGRASSILLVDDSPTALQALRKTLERWNYRVVTAQNGRQAWAELNRSRPDLVISDIDMPEMSGIELLQLMRKDLVLVDIPVLLITASPRHHLLASQQAGVNGLLAKPFEDRALIDQVRYILQE